MGFRVLRPGFDSQCARFLFDRHLYQHIEHQSYIGWQLDHSGSASHSLDPVIHEIGHDGQMDDLRCHEPISHIFRKETHRLISVEFGIRKNPKGYKQNSRNSLRSNKMRSE